MEDEEIVGTCWRDVADVLSAGVSRVLLYGPPGTGKTFAALHHGVEHGHAERGGEVTVVGDDLCSTRSIARRATHSQHCWPSPIHPNRLVGEIPRRSSGFDPVVSFPS